MIASPQPAPRWLRSVSPPVRVWMLSLLLAALALALVLGPVRALPAVDAVPALAWPLLALAFGLAEALVVSVQLDREGHTFSLSDVVLVVGLFVVAPVELVLAQAVGVGAVLVAVRRQAAMKLVFNLAQFALGTSLAVVVFHALTPADDPTGPQGWLAAIAAVVASTVVADLAIFSAVSLLDGRVNLGQFSGTFSTSLPFSIGTAAVGLVGVRVLVEDPPSLVLLAVPMLLVLLSYRAFHRARRHSENLQFVHDVTVVLHRGDLQTALAEFVGASRHTFRAGVAELVLLDPAGGSRVTRSVQGAPPVVMAELPQRQGDEVLSAAVADGKVLRWGPSRRRPATPLGEWARQRGLKELMAVSVRSSTRRYGVLLVANRTDDPATFRRGDNALFATLAQQAAAALENGRLAQSLAQVTELTEQLQHQAFHDALTGLPNRSLFLDRAARALETGRRVGTWPTMLYLDLDGFKPVNDALGHEAGDVLLQAVAGRLRGCLRPGDTAARLGGDEFAVLLEGYVDADSVLAVADRIREHIAEPVEVQGRVVRVGASIGIASGGPEVATTDQLVSRADSAMYAAKRAGGGRHVLRSGTPRRTALSPEGALAAALGDGRIVVHYQPIIDLATTRAVGAEALVRWDHPVDGLVLPDRFIPLAEQSELILDLGRHVLREACSEARSWGATSSHGGRPVVAVNLSAAHLAADLVADVEEALAAAALDPASLVLEITETMLVRDLDAAAATLARLRRLGVRIAVDDFGTGYSSLAYLSRFPVDVLKIATEFTSALGRDRHAEVIADAVIDLAGNLGLDVVAEGIETPSQAARLEALGCRLGQGFLFTRAVSASQVRRLVAAGAPAAVLPGGVVPGPAAPR